jgi:hypothetical protein
MNIIYVVFAIITTLIIAGTAVFLTLTRQGKNIVIEYMFRKKYVVCHLQNRNTGFEEIWKVIPSPDFMTKVSKYDYNLNPNYAIISWKNRLHFQLNEADVIPEYPKRHDTNEEVLIQVSEVKTALHNNAYKIIYGKKMDIAIILCGIALFISLIVAIYAVYTIGKITPMIDWLYAHPPTEIGNTVKIIQP